MNGWENTTLAELCRGEGLIQTGPFGSQLHMSDYTEHGIPVIMPTNLGDGHVDSSAIMRTSEEKARSLARHMVLPGDIVYSRRGDITKRALIREAESGWLCGTGCLLVRPSAQVHRRWLSYWLAQPRIHRWLFNHSVGATMLNLNTGILGRIPVSLPPLEEQRRIAAVLGAFDDLIETNRTIVADVAAFTSALYAEATARASSTIKLGSLLVSNPDRVTPGPPESDLRYLDIGAMTDGSVGMPTEMVWADAPSRARRGARRGDLLWATVRPNRRAHGLLMREIPNLVVSTGIAVLRPKSIPSSLAFAHTDAQSFVDRLVGRVDGSAYPAVKAGDFLALEVPDLRDQDIAIFETAVDPLWEAVGSLEEEIADLTRQRDELLPLLMSGKVQAPDEEGRG